MPNTIKFFFKKSKSNLFFQLGFLSWFTLLSFQGQAQYAGLLKSKSLKKVVEEVSPPAIKAHMTFLSDDLLEGRKPGKRGFALAANYMAAQFQGMGLEPGVNGTSYVQEVPLRTGKVQEAVSSLKLMQTGKEIPVKYAADYLLLPHMSSPQATVKADLVFVGYGVSAPELNYDDYAQVNVQGKIVVYLAGAPANFPNNERAYFSNGNTKLSAAAQKGAVGVISVIPATPNNSTWEAYVSRFRPGNTGWVGPTGNPSNYFPQLKGQAVMYQPAAANLFAGSGVSLDATIATIRGGKPASIALPVTAELTTATRYTDIKSMNIVGVLPGSDPVLKNEYVVYAAHLDHLGITAPVNGDSINNGAHDNAAGSGILLETARAFTRLEKKPKRSVIFVSCTGEEMGLLGSDYFATNPVVPASSIVANLALDMPFFFYPLRDIIPHGIQHSSLRGPVEAAANFLDIKITPDPAPEEVVFTRSDHYSFIKKGIPALFIKGGIITGDPTQDGAKYIADWRKNIYHKVDDEMDQPFDFKAAAMHVKTNFLIGYLVASDKKRPTWNTGDFFGGKFGRK